MRRLLLIDDSSIDILLFETALEELGVAAVVTAYSGGAEALAYLNDHAHEIDCVVLDLNMPEMNGFGVLEQLQAFAHCPPVIVLTTSEAQKDRDRALALGASDFMTKPMQFEELVGLVARVLQA